MTFSGCINTVANKATLSELVEDPNKLCNLKYNSLQVGCHSNNNRSSHKCPWVAHKEELQALVEVVTFKASK